MVMETADKKQKKQCPNANRNGFKKFLPIPELIVATAMLVSTPVFAVSQTKSEPPEFDPTTQMVPRNAPSRKIALPYRDAGLLFVPGQKITLEQVQALEPQHVSSDELASAEALTEKKRIPMERFWTEPLDGLAFSAVKLTGTNLTLTMDERGNLGFFRGGSIPAIISKCNGEDVIAEGSHMPVYPNQKPAMAGWDNEHMDASNLLALGKGGIELIPLRAFRMQNAEECMPISAIDFDSEYAVAKLAAGEYSGNKRDAFSVFRFFFNHENGEQHAMFVVAHKNGSINMFVFDDKGENVEFAHGTQIDRRDVEAGYRVIFQQDDSALRVMMLTASGNNYVDSFDPKERTAGPIERLEISP